VFHENNQKSCYEKKIVSLTENKTVWCNLGTNHNVDKRETYQNNSGFLILQQYGHQGIYQLQLRIGGQIFRIAQIIYLFLPCSMSMFIQIK
jgi:uncharacterized protein YutD